MGPQESQWHDSYFQKTTLAAAWRKVVKIIWVNNPLALMSESKSFFWNSFNDKTCPEQT